MYYIINKHHQTITYPSEQSQEMGCKELDTIFFTLLDITEENCRKINVELFLGILPIKV